MADPRLIELIRPHLEKARQAGYDAGYAEASRRLLEVVGNRVVEYSETLPSPTAKKLTRFAPEEITSSRLVTKAKKPVEPGADDPHGVLLAAMLQHAAECAETGEDPGEMIDWLADLAHDPERMADVLSGAGSAAVKCIGLLILKGKWNEDKHPRGKNGRFLSKDRIQAAATDPKVKAELEKEVRPEDADKLKAAIEDQGGTIGRTKRGEAKFQAGQRRAAQKLALGEARKIAEKIAGGEGTVEDVDTLASHLKAGLTRDHIRLLQSYVGGGGRKKADMVTTLLDAARDAVTAKSEPEADQPAPETPTKTQLASGNPEPLDLSVDNVEPVWAKMRDEITAHDPKISPAHAGALATARIMSNVSNAANKFMDEIDERDRTGKPISDEESDKYDRVRDMSRKLKQRLVELSGYRPHPEVDNHPLANRPFDAEPLTVANQVKADRDAEFARQNQPETPEPVAAEVQTPDADTGGEALAPEPVASAPAAATEPTAPVANAEPEPPAPAPEAAKVPAAKPKTKPAPKKKPVAPAPAPVVEDDDAPIQLGAPEPMPTPAAPAQASAPTPKPTKPQSTAGTEPVPPGMAEHLGNMGDRKFFRDDKGDVYSLGKGDTKPRLWDRKADWEQSEHAGALAGGHQSLEDYRDSLNPLPENATHGQRVMQKFTSPGDVISGKRIRQAFPDLNDEQVDKVLFDLMSNNKIRMYVDGDQEALKASGRGVFIRDRLWSTGSLNEGTTAADIDAAVQRITGQESAPAPQSASSGVTPQVDAAVAKWSDSSKPITERLDELTRVDTSILDAVRRGGYLGKDGMPGHNEVFRTLSKTYDDYKSSVADGLADPERLEERFDSITQRLPGYVNGLRALADKGVSVRDYVGNTIGPDQLRAAADLYEKHVPEAMAAIRKEYGLPDGKTTNPVAAVGKMEGMKSHPYYAKLTDTPQGQKLVGQAKAEANRYRQRKGLPQVDHELTLMPVGDVKPSQTGEDYINDSSRAQSKHVGEFGGTGRMADYQPIVVDENNNIIDGNHRHAAHVLSGQKVIPVLKPVAAAGGSTQPAPSGNPQNPPVGGPKEGDRNADGLVLRNGRWQREGEDPATISAGSKKKDEVTNGQNAPQTAAAGTGDATTQSGTNRLGSNAGGASEPESGQASFRPRIVTARAEHTKAGNSELLPKSVAPHLSPEQVQGAALAVEAMDKHGGFLNNDGTGVGKTRQQLAVAKTYADRGKKVLIIAPKGVTKADFKKGTLAGSFKDDSAAMGIPLSLTKGDSPLKPGQIAVSTYENLKSLKDHIDGDTVVLFDESHYMKNPTSARSKQGREIADKAGAVMYASATPADKATHIEHLIRAGVFGTQGKTKTFQKLGMELHDQHVGGGQYRKVWRVKPGVKKSEVARRLSGLFDQMSKDGLMVKRELSMDGVGFNTDHIQLSPEQHDEMKKVYDDVLHTTDGNKAIALMAARMHQEHMKIPHTVAAIQRDLAAGRSPVIFAGRVNDVGDEDEDETTDDVKQALKASGHSSQGTIPALKAALIAAGIPEDQIAELHGAASEKPEKAMQRFQDGKAKIMLATIQSGGTGINLDDTVGNRPRSVHIMTPPLTANDMAQAIGRVHRKNTKSASNIHAILSDTAIDQWNAGILHDKFRTLGAVSGGQITRGADVLGPSDVPEIPDETPYDWGQSLLDTRNYADTPAYHNELIKDFGGERVKRGDNWTTAFPSPQHYEQYRNEVAKRDAANRAKREQEAQTTASRPPTHHGGRGHSFTQLKNGSWGARVEGNSNEGDTATLTKRNGDKSNVKLGRVVWRGNGVTLHELA